MRGEEKSGLAKALRDLRHQRGWTLAEVAARSGIPASTLSKVENGKLSLSYDKIVALSHGLSVDIAQLFSGQPAPQQKQSGASSLPLVNRRSVNRGRGGHFVQTANYDHYYLSVDLLKKRIDPIIAEIRAKTMEEFGDWVRHPGEEFAYVLDGEVDFHTELYAPIRLASGDSVYFDSDMGHAYLAASDGLCRILSICTGEKSGAPALQELFTQPPIIERKKKSAT